jgi:hypothetical protein
VGVDGGIDTVDGAGVVLVVGQAERLEYIFTVLVYTPPNPTTRAPGAWFIVA